MSHQGLTMPVLVEIPPRTATESCGARAGHFCRVQLNVNPLPSDPTAGFLPEKPATPAPTPQISTRRSVKGCVFPASHKGGLECRLHELQQSEAALFQSHQPSLLLLLHSPFGIPDHEPDDARQKDRERQAAEREAFILDEAA